eukprot:TRINITY_DN19371_c0_g2_i1.p2 TRINITY_DN19371_c0_g2~~TRINITY_DN19371_c0_g2_i1.p2  ORF type:complete len:296 (-),score=13.75 TRINITY_DN19371_c0_g2_i1:328-1215(-)
MYRHTVSGYIFGCTNATRKECMDRNLFGAPIGRIRSVKKIKSGCLLFLYNYEDKTLTGVYRATTDGMENIDKYAWNGQFPAQIKFEDTHTCEVLPYDKYIQVLDKIGSPRSGNRMFNYELNNNQVDCLIKIMEKQSSSKPDHVNARELQQEIVVMYKKPNYVDARELQQETMKSNITQEMPRVINGEQMLQVQKNMNAQLEGIEQKMEKQTKLIQELLEKLCAQEQKIEAQDKKIAQLYKVMNSEKKSVWGSSYDSQFSEDGYYNINKDYKEVKKDNTGGALVRNKFGFNNLLDA